MYFVAVKRKRAIHWLDGFIYMFVQLLLNAVKAAASGELQNLLEKFKEKNGEEKYQQLIEAIRNSFTLLQDVVDDTKTKIDDTVVAMVLAALPE